MSSWTIILFKAPKSPVDQASDNDKTDDKFVTYLKCQFDSDQFVRRRVEMVQVLSFEYTGLEQLFEALRNPGKYEGLILTSPRCVESIRQSIDSSEQSKNEWKVNLKVKWALKRIFCVGPSTNSSVLTLFESSDEEEEAVKVSNVMTSSLGTALDLGKIILEESQHAPICRPLLYPGGNLQSDTVAGILNSGSIPFDAVTTYRTVQNSEMVHQLKSVLTDEAKFVFVFFSPSGLNFALPHCPLDSAQFIAIGPTTRSALEKVAGIDHTKIHQCVAPTPEALSDLIKTITKDK